jgi:branched-chain amino acid transport system substrate-binding protein
MDTKKNSKLFLIGGFCFFFLTYAPTFVSGADVVKIGVILPLSGPIAPIGKDVKDGLDYSVHEINESGGIKSLRGAKIQLIYTDSVGKPEVGLSNAERLIQKENASAIMGAYQSSVTYTSSEVAERYMVPYVVIGGIMDKITERGFKYIFRAHQQSGYQNSAAVRFVDEMGRKTRKEVKTIALVYENTDYGQDSARVWKEHFKRYDFKIVLDEAYPHGSTDLTPVVIKLKNIKPDAVFNVSYISDIILLAKTVADLKFECKAWIASGGGELDPTFIPAVGDLGNYYITSVPWMPDIMEARPWIKNVDKGFKAMTGRNLGVLPAMAYMQLNVLVDAIERAGSTDRKKIRDALERTDITSGKPLIMPFERIKFDEKGQNIYQRVVFGQFQKKELRIVYPEEFRLKGVNLVWPWPSWSER